MKVELIHDMLLFSKERGRYPYRYRLYFVRLDTLGSQNPEIHRFTAASREEFDSFLLGGIYTLGYRNLTIKNQRSTGLYHLTNGEYLHLVHLRDLQFDDDATIKRLGLLDPDYTPQENYYNLDSYKQLLDYHPTFRHRFTVGLYKAAAYFLSIIVPVAIYLVFLYFLSQTVTPDFLRPTQPLILPVAALGTLPFILWLMTCIFTLSELLLLNMENTRYDLLKSYTLRWAGMRRSCSVSQAQKHALFVSGIVSAAIMLVTFILIFLVF